MEAVHTAAFSSSWRADDVDAVREMRARLEASAPAGNMKRGPGGLMDIEFLVQMLELKHGHTDPAVRVPGTLAGLAALHDAGYLARDDFEYLTKSFRFLRTIQSRLRLMSTTARDVLPADANVLSKLAGLMRYDSTTQLLTDCTRYTTENRRRFDRLFETVAV